MDLDKILTKVKAALINTFGENMEGLMIYGSAAIGDYMPGVSDINLLIILKRVNVLVLNTMREFMKKTGRVLMTPPLIMTKEYIRSSADVFPIEFLEIQEKHRALLGEDVFAGLKISTVNLRHECEHELKGRLLRIRQSYLETRDSARDLRQMLISAHNANFPAFRAALRLKEVKPPLKKEEVTAALAVHFELDAELFHTVKRLRLREIKLNVLTLCSLIERYLIEVERLATIVDRL